MKRAIFAALGAIMGLMGAGLAGSAQADGFQLDLNWDQRRAGTEMIYFADLVPGESALVSLDPLCRLGPLLALPKYLQIEEFSDWQQQFQATVLPNGWVSLIPMLGEEPARGGPEESRAIILQTVRTNPVFPDCDASLRQMGDAGDSGVLIVRDIAGFRSLSEIFGRN